MKRGMKIAWAFLLANIYCIRYFNREYQINILKWHVTKKICLIRVIKRRGDGTYQYLKDFYSELSS